MLAGDHHAGDPAGQAEHILHRHLGFAVRAQIPDCPLPAGFGEHTGQAVGQHNRQRKQLVRFRTGKAVHDPLVTGTPPDRKRSRSIYRISDIGTLVMDHNFELIVSMIAGFTDSMGNNGRDIRKFFCSDLTRHNDFSCRSHGLAGDTGIRIVLQAGVQHPVRNSVAQLVRVPFRDRFCGLNVLISHMLFLS